MAGTRTAQNLDLGGHEPGYEWVAGETPPGDPHPGKWLVCLSDVWAVVFRTEMKVEYRIHTFSPNDEGEKAAKEMANKLVDTARESYRNDPRRRKNTEEVIW